MPPLRVPRRQGLHLQDLPGGRHTDLPLLGQGRQFTVQFHSEGQKIVPLVLQQSSDRPDSMRTAWLAGAQFRHDEVQQITADGVLRTGHREDIVAKPTG